MKTTIEQIAWYIERDGGKVSFKDGQMIVTVPFAGSGTIRYGIPEDQEDALNEARDRVYGRLAAKRRAAR